jgi:hypothetical protein
VVHHNFDRQGSIVPLAALHKKGAPQFFLPVFANPLANAHGDGVTGNFQMSRTTGMTANFELPLRL